MIPDNRQAVKKERQGYVGSAKVLIVEDEQQLADLYKNYLSRKYDVEVAVTGKKAISIADETTDVVLLDRSLRNMTGVEIMQRLNEKPEVDARFAMITAQKPTEDIIQLPIDEYKMKPVQRGELLAVVKTLELRDHFQETAEDLFSFTSKRGALQEADKTNTEEYSQLSDAISQRREQLNEILDKIQNGSVFRDFPW
jgi:DNA-binding response OmpR family regulator